jgi:putative secretion ATPase (PEP-CTERM system associated)
LFFLESLSLGGCLEKVFMYEKFFNFDCKPFELVPNPRFLYLSQSHRKAINYLRYGVQEHAGFILFTGEVGSGKTTILRDLIQKIDPDIMVSMVFNTRVDAQQLMGMINEDFGLEVDGKDKRTLLRDLNDFLIARHADNMRPIIIIDEAQNLCSEALEEIRLISNLETDNHKLVQIILVGQPELRTLINNPALRQLRQRIGVNCHLNPLTREETEAYVFHRLEVAGNRDAVSFHEDAFDVIYSYSKGIPRLVNVFCDFILLAAYVEETRDMTRELVEDVVGDVAWQENVNARPESSTNEGIGGTLPGEMFRKLSLIENSVLKANKTTEELVKLHKKGQAMPGLAQEVAKQGQQLQQLQESLGRIEQALFGSPGKNARQDKGRAINFKHPGRQKQGLFSRIFG